MPHRAISIEIIENLDDLDTRIRAQMKNHSLSTLFEGRTSPPTRAYRVYREARAL
jgi:hypothetical protein